MVDYLYDGTFDGLLTCVHCHYYEEKASGIYDVISYQTNIMKDSRNVITDAEKAQVVYKAIKNKISDYALRQVYHTFLSCSKDKENMILQYLILGFRKGPSFHSFHSDPVVKDVEKTAKRVGFEVHRLMGLVRFSTAKIVVDDDMGKKDIRKELLYGKIDPDNDILELLGDHFADRLKNEIFVLHDNQREKALFYQDGSWYIAYLPRLLKIEFSNEEEENRRLWKTYFRVIAIEARKNPKCQKSFMTIRYWKNLTEMDIVGNDDK